MQRYALRWGWGQSTASSEVPQMDCLHFLISLDRGRDAHLVHDAPSEAADQGVVLLQIVLHALYHVAHAQVVVGQACRRTSTPIKLPVICPGCSGRSIVITPCTWKSMLGRSVLQEYSPAMLGSGCGSVCSTAVMALLRRSSSAMAIRNALLRLSTSCMHAAHP